MGSRIVTTLYSVHHAYVNNVTQPAAILVIRNTLSFKQTVTWFFIHICTCTFNLRLTSNYIILLRLYHLRAKQLFALSLLSLLLRDAYVVDFGASLLRLFVNRPVVIMDTNQMEGWLLKKKSK